MAWIMSDDAEDSGADVRVAIRNGAEEHTGPELKVMRQRIQEGRGRREKRHPAGA
jgi:hypothetical protein